MSLRHNSAAARKLVPDPIHPGAIVFLTEACDKACPHCFNTLDLHMSGNPALLEIEPTLKLLAAAQERGLARVAFTGGEPMLHPRALDLVQGAHALALETTMFTSGTGLLDNAEALRAAGLDCIRFSCNAFPYVTDTNGLERTWRTLQEQLAPALAHFPSRVTVNIIVSRRSLPLVKALVDRLRSIGIQETKVQPLYLPAEHPMHDDLGLASVNDEAWRAHTHSLESGGLRGQVEYAHLFRSFFLSDWRPTACGASPMLVVGADGNIHPCLHRFDRQLGHLNEAPHVLIDRLANHDDLRSAACFREECLCLFRPQDVA